MVNLGKYVIHQGEFIILSGVPNHVEREIIRKHNFRCDLGDVVLLDINGGLVVLKLRN